MIKTITGIVSSDKSDKTIIVTVSSKKTHPLYHKQYKVSTKFMAHDEKNEAKIGDKVIIAESRPLSAKKRHILQQIIERPNLQSDDLKILQIDEKPKTETGEKS